MEYLWKTPLDVGKLDVLYRNFKARWHGNFVGKCGSFLAFCVETHTFGGDKHDSNRLNIESSVYFCK